MKNVVVLVIWLSLFATIAYTYHEDANLMRECVKGHTPAECDELDDLF